MQDVAVDVAAPIASLPRALARTFERLAAVPASAVLASMVAVSFVLRELAALTRVTPYMVPDEYYYRTLAHSLATTGQPLIRGHAAHFPALLAPIVTAPFQWFDPVTAYRLTQAFDVLAMSLAAVPAYLLARRLGLGERLALGCGAVTITSPALFYASFILSEPIAYPLALTALYAGVCALDRPSTRAQLVFLGLSGLTTFARIQYVLLPFAFAGAALFLERLRAFRTWRVTAILLIGGSLLAFALGPTRFIGVYAGGAKQDWALSTLLAWIGRDGMLLAYSSGWIILPAGLIGLLCVRTRVERAFAALSVLLAAGLLLQAGWIAAIDSKRFEERYLMVLVPLVAVAFGIWAKRGAPWKRGVALVTLLMLLFSMRVPLSGYVAAHGKDGSPLLGGVLRLEQLVGVANGSFIVAIAAAVLSLIGLAITFRPRFAPAGISLAVIAMVAVSWFAHSFDQRNAQMLRTGDLPGDVQWVDHAGVKNVALLTLPNSDRALSLEHLFWNRSITDVYRFGGDLLDGYSQPQIDVADDGRLLVPGGAFARPLLVQTYGSRATFTGATKIGTGKKIELWKPEPGALPRFDMLVGGLYYDGWLAWHSFISLWPDASGRVEGTLRLELGLPADAPRSSSLTLAAPGYARTVQLAPGKTKAITIPVSTRGRWTVKLSSRTAAYLGLRAVIARALPPVFTRAVEPTV